LRKILSSTSHKTFNLRKCSQSEKNEISKKLKKEDIKNKDKGKTIFIKFNNEKEKSINDETQMKKILNKYGEVINIFRKIEGRTFYIEFKSNVKIYIFIFYIFILFYFL
jgi:hypothetical protein